MSTPDPRWDEDFERRMSAFLALSLTVSGFYVQKQSVVGFPQDQVTRELLVWLADNGLLVTPRMVDVLAAAKALRDWHRGFVPPGPLHTWHIRLDELESALVAAVDASETNREH